MVIRACDTDAAALKMFRDGKSKADIGKALGKDKKAVSKILARAINNSGRNTHGTD